MTEEKKKPLPVVYACYRDHVFFSRANPLLMKPELRETVGWLLHECNDYVIISWDREAGPPTLKGGDAKASGLVLLRSDILELRTLG